MRAILVHLPHHQVSGVMVRRPTGFMRLPLPSVLPICPAPISLPSSTRCASTSSSSAEDIGTATAAVVPAAEKRPSPWLFVGLGNPGTKYQGTRHNVGFDMIDAIAQAEGISLSTIQFKALVGKGQIGGAPVLLAKPQTYMNLSGESVKPLASYYKIPAERVLAIYDDLDLEFAVMRLLPKGGHGGHNGMRSILQHFSSRDIARLRIGIGRPPGQMDVQAYVLQKFSANERQELDFALHRGVDAIRLVTLQGLDKAVSTWNQVRKSKISKMTYSDIKIFYTLYDLITLIIVLIMFLSPYHLSIVTQPC